MTDFFPTHRITTATETVDVMLVDGAAYTQAEWDSSSAADYERSEDGKWTFQGEAFDGTVSKLEGDKSAADRTHRLYCEARSRVEADEQLAPYADTILADFPEGDDHWQWVIDARTDEIVAWAKAANR